MKNCFLSFEGKLPTCTVPGHCSATRANSAKSLEYDAGNGSEKNTFDQHTLPPTLSKAHRVIGTTPVSVTFLEHYLAFSLNNNAFDRCR